MDCICPNHCVCPQSKSQPKKKRVSRVMALLIVFGCALVCAMPSGFRRGSLLGSGFSNISRYYSGLPPASAIMPTTTYNAYLTNNTFNMSTVISPGAVVMNSNIGTASTKTRL